LVTSKAKNDARLVAAGAATGQGDLAGFNRTGKVKAKMNQIVVFG
jgi:hypothetical protein